MFKECLISWNARFMLLIAQSLAFDFAYNNINPSLGFYKERTLSVFFTEKPIFSKFIKDRMVVHNGIDSYLLYEVKSMLC